MDIIAVIDSHPVPRYGLEIFLSENFIKKTILVSESKEALYLTHPLKNPDLIILSAKQDNSINMLNIHSLKKSYPAAKIIFYDESPHSSQLTFYLQAGISGYISKQNSGQELIECIQTMEKNKMYVCNEVLTALIHATTQKAENKYGDRNSLTVREFEIANLLSQGMKTSDIANYLFRKSSTISTTKAKIFKKLNVDNILQLKAAMN